MNEKVEVLIGTRRLTVEMEGLIPMEINALAQKVTERMTDIQAQNNKVADSSKIALLVALSFAADYERERSAHERTKNMLDSSAEKLSKSLRDSLEAGAPPVPE
jgi:cell division protein ZapA (FtsZ GTPase activity inhibitor)